MVFHQSVPIVFNANVRNQHDVFPNHFPIEELAECGCIKFNWHCPDDLPLVTQKSLLVYGCIYINAPVIELVKWEHYTAIGHIFRIEIFVAYRIPSPITAGVMVNFPLAVRGRVMFRVFGVLLGGNMDVKIFPFNMRMGYRLQRNQFPIDKRISSIRVQCVFEQVIVIDGHCLAISQNPVVGLLPYLV